MKNVFFELEVLKTSKLIRKGEHVVVGYCTTYDLDSDKTIITPKAIADAKDDLLKYSTVLFNHDTERPIGKVVNTAIDHTGLLVEIVISKEEKEIWNKVKEGIINKFSIKGRASDFEEVVGHDGEKILKINKLELYEVSLVSVPANAEAKTISWYVAKSLKDMSKLKKKDSKLQEVRPASGSPETEIEEVLKIMKTGDIISTLKTALTKKTVNGMSKTIKNLLDKISASYPCPEKIKKAKNELIDKLKKVVKKASDDDKEVIEDVINTLSKSGYGSHGYYGYIPGYGQYYSPYRYLSPKKASDEFDFADESDTRPIFQLNTYGKISLDDEGTFRKQVLKKGKWYHWSAEGGILNITAEKIAQIIKNFKDHVLDNVTIPLTHTTNPAMNTGEVVKLIETKDGLDAVCKIKDKSIAKKIKDGLIKSISASIDPNYQDKKTGKFTGPVLLHTALVHEPYIKGMKGFVPLSDDFKNRPVFVLEDEAITPAQNFLILKELVEKIAQKLDIQADNDKIKDMKKLKLTLELELPKELTTDIEKSAYTTCVGKKLKEGMSFNDAVKFCIKKVKKGDEETDKKEEKEGETKEEVKEEIKKEVKKDISEDTSEKSEEDEVSEKESSKEEETEEVSKEKVSEETAEEKTSEEETKEEAEKSKEKPEEESEESAQQEKVELADAERVYDKFLKAGKLVPAQKDTIISLLTSKNVVELGDKAVDIRKALETFLENQPQIINFEEKGTSETSGETKLPLKKEEVMPEDVKDFYVKKMNLSEENADIAWHDAKKLAETERKKSTIF